MPKAPPENTERARELRRVSTDAERKLWQTLRDRRLAGVKFRRQVPVGPYVADFVCWDAKLIVELDGGQHADRSTQDERRTRYLESRGFRVIRFWNADLKENADAVVAMIARALRS